MSKMKNFLIAFAWCWVSAFISLLIIYITFIKRKSIRSLVINIFPTNTCGFVMLFNTDSYA